MCCRGFYEQSSEATSLSYEALVCFFQELQLPAAQEVSYLVLGNVEFTTTTPSIPELPGSWAVGAYRLILDLTPDPISSYSLNFEFLTKHF